MAALFGSEPCTSRFMAAQRAGLWHDLLAFIPAYAAFLGLAAWALRSGDRRWGTVALAAALAAALLDELEGVTMFALLDSFPGRGELFAALFWTVRPKFALLAVAEIAMALAMLRHGWLARLAAVPIGLAALASLAVLFIAPHGPWLLRTYNYAWIALLVLALVAAVRPSLVARRATV